MDAAAEGAADAAAEGAAEGAAVAPDEQPATARAAIAAIAATRDRDLSVSNLFLQRFRETSPRLEVGRVINANGPRGQGRTAVRPGPTGSIPSDGP